MDIAILVLAAVAAASGLVTAGLMFAAYRAFKKLADIFS